MDRPSYEGRKRGNDGSLGGSGGTFRSIMNNFLKPMKHELPIGSMELDGLKGLRAIRDYPNEAGQPVARTKVVLPESHNKDTVIQDLLQGEPMISVAPSETENALLLNPMTVKDEGSFDCQEEILEVMG